MNRSYVWNVTGRVLHLYRKFSLLWRHPVSAGDFLFPATSQRPTVSPKTSCGSQLSRSSSSTTAGCLFLIRRRIVWVPSRFAIYSRSIVVWMEKICRVDWGLRQRRCRVGSSESTVPFLYWLCLESWKRGSTSSVIETYSGTQSWWGWYERPHEAHSKKTVDESLRHQLLRPKRLRVQKPMDRSDRILLLIFFSLTFSQFGLLFG